MDVVRKFSHVAPPSTQCHNRLLATNIILKLALPFPCQAILDLEEALVSSSPATIGSTSTVERGIIDFGNATSSWLRGFVDWLPSSPYASVGSGSGDEVDLWAGTAEQFNTAMDDFLADPQYQR